MCHSIPIITRYSRKLVVVVIVCSVVEVGSVVVCVVVSIDVTAVVMSGCVVASVETEKIGKNWTSCFSPNFILKWVGNSGIGENICESQPTRTCFLWSFDAAFYARIVQVWQLQVYLLSLISLKFHINMFRSCSRNKKLRNWQCNHSVEYVDFDFLPVPELYFSVRIIYWFVQLDNGKS